MTQENIRKRSPLWYELPILLLIIGGIIAFVKIRKDDPKKAKICLILGIIFTIPIFMGIIPFEKTTMISSGSMMPDLEPYDVVTISSTTPFEEIQIGDIIAFNRPSDHNRIIIHRVTEILDNNPLTLKTKGDANPVSIPGTDFPITEEEYMGKIVSVTPELGIMTKILTPPTNYLIMFGSLIIPIILHFRFLRDNKNST